MECPKWQENGLLFVSGEADARQNEEFNEHMRVCIECKNEVEAYEYDKRHFFQQDFFTESPSEAINKKIIAACSHKPVTTLGFSLFSGVWMKKALLSTFFLVFGIGAGVYFTMHYSNSISGVALSKSEKASSTTVTPVNQKATPAVQLAKVKAGDSAKSNKKDSLKANEAVSFPGNQKSGEGIIPVDLKKE
jgi:hypothetical protein